MPGPLVELLRLCIEIKIAPPSDERVRMVKHAHALLDQYPPTDDPVANRALSVVVMSLAEVVRHPLAALFLSTPREPLRHVYPEPLSHFIRYFDESAEDLCFPYDYETQEWIDCYDSDFSRSRQPPTRFCDWDHTKIGLYYYLICPERILKQSSGLR
jgi:hypothetical protein